jgi:FAD binding domain
MNTGIQDSFNLGWKLAHVVKGLSPPSLLDTYTEERLPVVTEMLNLTTKILKATIDKPNNEAGWRRTGKLNQLGVNYRWSSIVVDQNTDSGTGPGAREAHSAYDVEAGGVLHAGDRAPDASGLVKVNFENQKSGESTRLFKLLSPTRHTVLIFADAADVHATLQGAIAKFSKELVLRAVVILRAGTAKTMQDVGCDVFEDRDEHAYDAYKGTEGPNGIVIIRPDGVTGAIVKDVDWVERYFRAIFVESP